MSAKSLDASVNLIDSAIGPLAVATTDWQDFDIDNFVHLSARSQALEMTIQAKAKLADPEQAKDRTPVVTDDGIVVGGY